MSGSLTRRLAALERCGGPQARSEEVRRAVAIDEFLARQLGQEPKPREQIEAEVRAGKYRTTEIPGSVRQLLDAHLGQKEAPK